MTVSSYAVDGVSYLSTGKSLTDHALSDLAGRDCATWRILKRRAICRDFTPEELALHKKNMREIRYDDDRAYIATGLEGIDMDSGVVVAAKPKAKQQDTPKAKREWKPPVAKGAPQPVVKREDLPPAAKASQEVVARPAVRPAKAQMVQPAVAGSRYLVFGSFHRRADADRFASKHAVLKPAVVAVWVRGKRYFRVFVRPDGREALDTAMHTLRSRGIRDAYTMRACRPDQRPDRRPGNCMRPAGGGDGSGGRADRPGMSGG